MRSGLFVGLAVGLAACAADTTTDSSGWYRYDGAPINGNAALEKQFKDAYAMCYGSNKNVYRECMSTRGFTEQPVAVASSPMTPAPAAVISTASPDWHARAAEARALAAQLKDPASRKTMDGIAEAYDRLAAQQDRSRAH